MRTRALLGVAAVAVAAVASGAAGRLPIVARAAGPSVTTVNNREVLLSDSRNNFTPSQFIAKGFVYMPQPIGSEYTNTDWTDPVVCENDATLMQGAGVTLIRAGFDAATAKSDPSAFNSCLDSFYNHGIGVMWNVAMPGETPVNVGTAAPWVAAFEQLISQAVSAVGSNPATYLWEIDNEADGSNSKMCSTYQALWDGVKSTGQVGLADQLIQYTQSLDSNHLVGTVVSWCTENVGLASTDLPHLQYWGLNDYGSTHTPSATFFSDFRTPGTAQYDPRPLMFSEWGTDRFSCVNDLDQVFSCVLPRSGETQADQRDWDVQSWKNIASDLATDANPGGADFGGTAFMWSDLWYYSLAGFNPTSPETHDMYGNSTECKCSTGGTDGTENFEWWGITGALPAKATYMRQTSLAFDGLAAQWNSTAPPTLTSPSAAIKTVAGACKAVFTWTTSEPATSEVEMGPNLEVIDAGNLLYQDNTIYQPAFQDSTLVTSHSAVFTYGDDVPMAPYKAYVRSFTADGRSAVSNTLRLTSTC